MQNLDGQLPFLKQLPHKGRNQVLRFQRILRNFLLEELYKPLFQHIQKSRRQPPHIHGHQRLRVQGHAVRLCAICRFNDVFGFYHFGQVGLRVHFADTAGDAAIVRQGILEHKARHTGLTALCQVIVDLAKAIFAVIVVGVDDSKRCMDQIFSRQDRLTGAPGLGTAFGKLAGDVV